MADQHQRRILIVDDEPEIVEVIRVYLEDEGFAVEHVADGEAGLEQASSKDVDLVLLDLNLPKVSGVEVFRRLRQRSNVPVIMVTTRGEEIDRVVGLELGADDYVAKPFSPRELVARVKSVLRRAVSSSAENEEGPAPKAGVQCIGELEIDRLGHEVRRAGKRLGLTPMEFRILDVLSQHVGQVFTRARLLDLVSDMGNDIFDRTLDRHIANLRKKLGDDPNQPHFIETVLGVGYKFLG